MKESCKQSPMRTTSSVEEQRRGLVRALHDVDVKACLVVTGGGISAVSELFAGAGASRSIIEVSIPYAFNALDEYLGRRAESHVSPAEARIMAIKAYERAVRLTDGKASEVRLTGVSCTAAIATDRVRRGENRCHVAWHDGQTTVAYSIVLSKGARDREGEEAVCRTLILNALAEAFGIHSRLALELLSNEHLERHVGR